MIDYIEASWLISYVLNIHGLKMGGLKVSFKWVDFCIQDIQGHLLVSLMVDFLAIKLF